MYKVIHNNLIIDVLKSPTFLKYLGVPGKFAVTDKYAANAVYSKRLDEVYLIEGKIPQSDDYKIVKLQLIGEAEFNAHLSSLNDGKTLLNTTQAELIRARGEKIEEMKSACNVSIWSGISVRLSDGFLHHYTLTVEDQLNLMYGNIMMRSGQTSFIYHDSGKECELISSKDLNTIIVAANKHITYHTTYFNLMRSCINELDDVSIIDSLKYGDTLPIERIKDTFNAFIYEEK